MTWQNLPPINLTQAGAYVPLPLAGAGGRVPLQIPPFSVGERGLYEVGIYDLPQGGPPGLVAAAQTAQIAPYTRSLVFEVPPSIAAPHVGIRLLSHEDLETASYSVAIKWQPPYGSGTGNGGGTPVPSGFMAAISWTEIKQAAIAEIAQGYATVESVATGLSEIQEAIDNLGTSEEVQEAIADEALARTQADEALGRAIANVVPSGSDGNLLQRVGNQIAAIADFIYFSASNLLRLPSGLKIRPSADSAIALSVTNASGSKSILDVNSVQPSLSFLGGTGVPLNLINYGDVLTDFGGAGHTLRFGQGYAQMLGTGWQLPENAYLGGGPALCASAPSTGQVGLFFTKNFNGPGATITATARHLFSANPPALDLVVPRFSVFTHPLDYDETIGDFPTLRLSIEGKNIKPALPEYSSHSAADSDNDLQSGALYKLTGNPSVYQKP